MTEIANRIRAVRPSATLALGQRADEMKAQGKPIINMSLGEPDFDTPQHIKNAAIKALEQGFTKYTAVDGIKNLKQAIIDKFAKENNLNYKLKQILVSCGAKHSLFNILMATLNPGDEVIIPAPYWVSYPDMVEIAEGKSVIIKTEMKNNFKITAQQLHDAITSKTRMIILNSPCNPSGMVYNHQELQELAKVLLKHPNILIITDDIYEHILWEPSQFENILNVCPDLYDRCIVVNGVSKAYAMTGWRIGYAAGSEKIIAAMKNIQSQSTSNPTSIAQAAAVSALTDDQTHVGLMARTFKSRHDLIWNELQKMPGVKCLPSQGTFYSFPSIEDVIYQSTQYTNDLEFSEYLLQEANIAVVPGSAFGTPGHLRISFATTTENIQEAMRRMKMAIEKL